MSGTVHLFGQETSYSSFCVTLFWINLLEIFLIGLLPLLYYRMVKGEKTNHNNMNQFFGHCVKVVILLVALLSKPHNVMLLGALIASSRYVTRSIDRVADMTDTNLALKIITHYWLGKAFYFYQGNSNSLATIDVNAGYVGLEHFDMFRVGFFLTLQTFCGPIISFLMLIHHLRFSQQSYK
ncbi:GPI ethanolamine phosphate transferase 2-like [Anopheles bellator]|uniref:GPI ethanolamine phosphate transferase 2-like n=1 Tax=Anopheles bellator TaxID=139047 RepID=UPI0026478D84|nr:GPI ethanolamine phosphate transferase 2-like [Anopheles bellator]